MDKDIKYMRKAIVLAKKGFGRTSPNPIVGAVVVRNGKIVGKGWHKKAGTPHAEINAIADAGDKTNGATLYVTLEPCSTHGKTPPCTDAIISAKFAKVVIGCLDSNPDHNGKAVEILKNAGIKIITDVEKDKCIELNKAFFYWVSTGMPYVILKMAMTLDGKTATSSGSSKWITGSEARKSVQKLRRWSDAIMVGGETVRKDSPSLTVRNKKGIPLKNWNQPERIVVSRTLDAQKALKLMGAGDKKPIVIKSETASDWEKELKKLGSKGITAILVEGGSELASSVINAKMVNEAVFYIAPKILGGKNSIPVIGGANPDSLAQSYELENVKIKKVGIDIMVTGSIKTD